TAAARRHRLRAGRATASARRIERRREECARDSTYFAGTRTRYDGALRVAVRMPCDTSKLSNSPDLPGSIYEPGEAVFGAGERDALLEALDDFGLQPGWSPQRPRVRTGLDLVRFNRIEGLSAAAEATSALGAGYTAAAQLRLGTSDLVPNAELSLTRSTGAKSLRLGAFHRLGVANDDWGSPLSLGASLAGLLYGRDEGFYYRTYGAELSGTRERLLGNTPLQWRLFAERQREATRELSQTFTGADFIENIRAQQASLAGAGGELSRTFGIDPEGWRLFTRARAEGAVVDWSGAAADAGLSAGYGRGVLDATVSRGFGRFAAALTAAGGGIAGDAPVQRQFYVGGYQTVRGQFARPDTAGYAGNAFWLTRSELGFNTTSARPAVFFDMGWAGDRRDLSRPGRPLSGYGVGLSILDGLFRMDLSRGLYPQKRTRFDLALDVRF
ncbi:BamA/TamA family outer membrane protein, partial [Roseisolibacter sp. H3M3-2]|uniref:BamA/TamA family outer membrane protein n=1 Tax=Roseisolibacter sp. H3M3-2 TaxID=3031323 RepID=UPI0023DB8590